MYIAHIVSKQFRSINPCYAFVAELQCVDYDESKWLVNGYGVDAVDALKNAMWIHSRHRVGEEFHIEGSVKRGWPRKT